MGYIPPIRNEQLIQYRNRLIRRFKGISPNPPVIKGKFQEVLTKEKPKRVYRSRVEKRANKPTNHESLKDFTQKGLYINELV